MAGSLGGFVDPETLDDGPDPADDDDGGEPLEDAVAESVALELVTSAGGDHGAEAGPNDVQDEAHNGEGGVELDHRLFAASNCLVHLFFAAHCNFQTFNYKN